MIVIEILVAIIIVAGVVFTMTHQWQKKFNNAVLAKSFYWFALINGVLAIFTQYGFVYQVGTQDIFAEPTFYFLLGMLSMLGGIYLNTERRE